MNTVKTMLGKEGIVPWKMILVLIGLLVILGLVGLYFDNIMGFIPKL